MNWKDKKVLVTGGASFIGSHLVDRLVELGVPYIRIVDDLSSGKLENLEHHDLKNFEPSVDLKTLEPQFKSLGNGIYFWRANLLNQIVSEEAVSDIDVVFHLAADHGGRGYVDSHAVGPATNMALDGLLFKACVEEGVEHITYTSSGCIYPNEIQQDTSEKLYLTEEDAGPPYDPDNEYGWAKLSAEITLQAYYKEQGLESANPRLFTVYGDRSIENHAITAMIGRAFLKQDPYKVWGYPEVIRNWTFVEDTVDGIVKSAENIKDGSAVNIGVKRRISVSEAVHTILDYVDYDPELKYLEDKPVGVKNRVADDTKAKELLGWEPKVSFEEGIKRTIDWYFEDRDREKLRKEWGEELLMER